MHIMKDTNIQICIELTDETSLMLEELAKKEGYSDLNKFILHVVSFFISNAIVENNDLGSRLVDVFKKRGLTEIELSAYVRHEEGEDEYDIAEGLEISPFEAQELIYDVYQKLLHLH